MYLDASHPRAHFHSVRSPNLCALKWPHAMHPLHSLRGLNMCRIYLIRAHFPTVGRNLKKDVGFQNGTMCPCAQMLGIDGQNTPEASTIQLQRNTFFILTLSAWQLDLCTFNFWHLHQSNLDFRVTTWPQHFQLLTSSSSWSLLQSNNLTLAPSTYGFSWTTSAQ